jgi:16S rRNA (adenine1518-N6/adenine1519-N6)-dimethyltransferase
MKIASREYVVKKLTSLMINPKKKYSQNFLTDYDTVKESVDSLMINEEDVVIEIGPGLGALTQELINRGNQVYAFDIDSDMYNHLKEEFKHCSNFHVYNEDFMKVDLSCFSGKSVRVISNVPYNLTTPIIEKIVTSKMDIKAFEFMVQKEVFDRIKAKKGSKDYAPLNIFIEYVGKLSLVKKVTKDKFIPVPNVDSVVLKIDFINQRKDEAIEREFFNVTKACFVQRRKTIQNNLNSYFNNKEKTIKILSLAGIEVNTRGEQLELKDYLKLSEIILNNK